MRQEGDLLVGITGDMDNLGIFVSRHGRPAAENLVDVYNHLVGAFLYDLARRAGILHFVVIPSGEELFAFGICRDRNVISGLFSSLQKEANEFIQVNCPIKAEGVAISFGCKVLEGKDVDSKTISFLKHVDEGCTPEGSLAYLEMMYLFRTELALELDIAKFESLNIGKKFAILFRNIVYAHMLDYKRTTHDALVALARRAGEDAEFGRKLETLQANSLYGLSGDTHEESLRKLL